ncbi:universal stress protein [Streptomyces boncukensis]|uniref:Universal stress protein n=1 Tax=Streptomyces boncukensis TaxID=2711219 RepID=A0A6G4WYT5_9ACTN|nr:universal stress protein [Streptomyces boncukensis]NGO70022.1 universal stress protein [Streptomyces boncukensis]
MTDSSEHPPIVVGITPDTGQREALLWAAAEAQHSGAPLLLVHAWGMPSMSYGAAVLASDVAANLRAQGEQALTESEQFVTDRYPQVEVTGVAADEQPAEALRARAAGAAMVVLGARPPSKRGPFPVSAVALPVMAHVHCPVAVVPEEARKPATGEPFLVVGVDGSPSAAAAARLAFGEAAARGAALRAVCAWHSPWLGSLDVQAVAGEAERTLEEVVSPLSARHPGVRVEQEAVAGHPVQVLTDAAEGATGLVVGSRGHGGFVGMLLGSVSQGVLRHARCPVVVVPPAAEP